ncbi:MAG TPA: DMT family transporter [Geminicoccaceae bacterium]|nr:DMT family transporter [Geminicoccaceae bacterium]
MSGARPAPRPDAAATGRTALGGSALRGLTLMFVSTFFFAAMHASIRHVSETIHPFEIAFFRSVFALAVVTPWFWRQGFGLLHTRRPGLHALRAIFNVFAMLSFFYALTITPLSEVTALNFTAPIFASLLAALILGEVVRLRRWGAIVVGFAGTLVILRPGFAEVGLGEILVLFSSLVWAFALLVIKTLSRTDSSATIIAYMALLMMPLTLIPAAFVWQWPDAVELLWLVLVGLLGGAGQLLMTEALRSADTAVVMPIDFCKLPWVAAIAYLAFDEVPDLYTWLGGAIIFASSFYIAYRERPAPHPRP